MSPGGRDAESIARGLPREPELNRRHRTHEVLVDYGGAAGLAGIQL